MYYTIDYTELLSYQEYIEASSKEEAVQKFTRELEKGAIEPLEAEIGEFTIN